MTNEKNTIETVEQVEEKGENIMKENIETIATEFVETEQIANSKPMFTISKDMLVVETDEDFSNPLSYDKEAIQLFLDNNKYALERYFNDNENNYGIGFYACGFNGTAQQEFAQAWADSGVRVF